MQALLLFDFVWLWIGDLLFSPSLEDPTRILVFTGVAAGIQWYFAGYGIGAILEKRNNDLR